MNTRKSKVIPILPSRITVEGLDRAPHRAFLRGLGLSDNDIKRPFVGVASTDGRVTPCNALLGALAKDACAGWGFRTPTSSGRSSALHPPTGA